MFERLVDYRWRPMEIKKTSETRMKGTLWDAFELTYRLHWKGSKNEDKAVANFMRSMTVLGREYPVAQVDGQTIMALIDSWKRDGLSNGTVNRLLSAMMRVLNVAHRAGMRPTPPPSSLFLKEAPHRTRVVTDAELSAMVGVMSPWAGRFARFLMETGMRVSEALSLERRDVKWKAADMENPHSRAKATQVTIRESKNGTPRTIPLTTDAAEIIRTITLERVTVGNDDPAIFKFSQRMFNLNWFNARWTIGLKDDKEFVPHALRHTCATRLVERGVPLPVVQKWMGHKTIQQTMRYAHVGDDSLQQAANKLDRWK